MTSAMRAMAVTISPPAPRPCTARAPISMAMFCASPHTAEPATNTTALSWNMNLRPNRSPNLPASTVPTVSASRYPVTTQDMCPAPPRSATIVGRAVATIVWSSAASSMPSTIALKMTFICRRLRAAGARTPPVLTAVLAMIYSLAVRAPCRGTIGENRDRRSQDAAQVFGAGRAGRLRTHGNDVESHLAAYVRVGGQPGGRELAQPADLGGGHGRRRCAVPVAAAGLHLDEHDGVPRPRHDVQLPAAAVAPVAVQHRHAGRCQQRHRHPLAVRPDRLPHPRH